jgi:transporter family-2 protein
MVSFRLLICLSPLSAWVTEVNKQTADLLIGHSMGGSVIAEAARLMPGRVIGLIGIDTLESIFITYCGGGLLIGLAMLVTRGGNLANWQAVPWYALTAGILGLVIVGTIGYGTARLGLVTTLIIVILAQFITGAVLDHFGILGAECRPMNSNRIFGMGLMLLGTWLIIK